MGRAKEELERRWMSGYGYPEDHLNVCPRHVGDAYLDAMLCDHADDDLDCTFCSEGGPAAPLHVLVETLGDTMHRYYSRANDAGVPFEDGDWAMPVLDTYDIVAELLWDGDVDDDVAEEVRPLFDDEAWVPAYEPERAPDVPLREGWQRFCEYVKHQSRFLLKRVEDFEDPYSAEPWYSPLDMLRELTKILWKLDLVDELPAGTVLYRGRATDDARRVFRVPNDFTSPPEERAGQGRMNPAGISVFYGALEPETAAVEVYRGLPHAAVAAFQLVTPLDVVDLTKVADPSRFDPRIPTRVFYATRFLHRFVDEVSKPIVHDERIHREYIPTQVFTEYLRYRMLPSPAAIGGIVFPSSMAPGGKNIVVFTGPSGCLTDEQLETSERIEPHILLCSEDSHVIFDFEPPRASRRAPSTAR